MFFEFFENIRSKPREARKRYALIFSSACTSVVVLVWIISLILTSFGQRGSKDLSASSVNTEKAESSEDTRSTLFKKSNGFINSQETGDSNQSWVRELQTFDESTEELQRHPVDTALSTSSENVHASTSKSNIFE